MTLTVRAQIALEFPKDILSTGKSVKSRLG